MALSYVITRFYHATADHEILWQLIVSWNPQEIKSISCLLERWNKVFTNWTARRLLKRFLLARELFMRAVSSSGLTTATQTCEPHLVASRWSEHLIWGDAFASIKWVVTLLLLIRRQLAVRFRRPEMKWAHSIRTRSRWLVTKRLWSNTSRFTTSVPMIIWYKVPKNFI